MNKCVLNVCKAGKELLVSGYCLYSSSTIFVLTIGNGVYGFTFDALVGEFILSHPNIRIPDKGKIYSFNSGNYNGWTPELQVRASCGVSSAVAWRGRRARPVRGFKMAYKPV